MMGGYCSLYFDKPESPGLKAPLKTQNNQAHQQFIYMFVNTMELDPKLNTVKRPYVFKRISFRPHT